ncbi:hypothetical protein N6H18_14805 [Reichenbachiella agarivorans]|uniref:Tetratricopeptide repeat-containing protein n=1 Tax=Reichenbachiella agarivorans TaxID=2979464 RepID=A0ABY6CQI6_9BACT|nr:hypothetical protein [Reichenbachiella agarivorans]UXP31618.1 hypothetical protein N6H18_14805 [Reichenbachiella agarivorans]
MDRLKIVLVFVGLGISLSTFGQGILQRDGLSKMDQGAQAMYDGHYEEADQLFRESMNLLGKLPSEMAYYFGRNSYHLAKYKQAINWLTKYVQLKGTSGQYYDEAVLYLDRSNEAYKKIKEQEVHETENKLTTDGYYDCPSSYVMCPICHGGGVLIKQGKFGAEYQTCPYSGISGKLTCEQYNQYLMGELGMEMSDE